MQQITPDLHPATARALPGLADSGADQPNEWRRLRQDLRQAAHDCAFALAFQPRVALHDNSLRGVHGQLRWPRRRGGLAAPGSFMPLLAECGLAESVAAWALTAACTNIAAWPDIPLCMSVPGTSLQDGSLLGQVGAALAASGLAPERLEIALPEPAISADPTEALLTIAALRDLGIGVTLDDFGAASANLLTLKRLPLTGLKLDRSLVRDVPQDREAAAVVLAATHFAHALDVTVVACGVETAAQHEFLRRAGCDQAQGSLCGKAVAGDAIGMLVT